MRGFFIRGLEGKPINDNVYILRRSWTTLCLPPGPFCLPAQALTVLKQMTKSVESVDEVGKALKKVEQQIACNTFVLVRWHDLAGATAEAPIDHDTEMSYLKELALPYTQTN
jgi:hypothetical protein